MKVVIVLVVLVAAVVIGVKYLDTGLKTPQFDVHTAFGEPADSGIQMDIALTQRMVEREELEGNSINNSAWQVWMDRHFELLDASGAPLPIKYRNGSNLIGSKPGSPEVGFLSVFLVPGQTYTLRYRPVRDEPLVAKVDITAPDRSRSMFLLKLVGRVRQR